MSDLDTKEEKEPKPETSTEVKTDENVWQNILRKSTTKSKDINSNLIVLGDKKNGKSLMLDKFSDRKINSNAQQYVLDYSYLQVKNKHNADKEETLAHLNIWQIDDPTHLELLPMLLNSTRNGVGSTVYMITLNLAEPSEAMDSLSKWLKLLEQVNEKVMEGISASEKENLKRKISHHIQFYVDPSVQQKVTEAVQITEEETKKTKLVDPAKPDTNLGVPLIIVGCQADSFKRKSAKTGINTEDDEKFDFLTRRLRKVCLTYGATLVYTSSNGTKGINIEYLQDYLYNRLYNIPFKHSAKVVGSVEEFGVAIPSGHDNKDLIETDRAPSKSGWNDETAFEEVFKKRPKAKEKNKNEAKVIDAQPNEEFFRQLSLHTAEPSSGGTKEAKKPRIPPMEQDPIKKPAPTGTTARPTGTAPTTENNAAVKQFFRSLLTSSTAKGDPSRSRSRSKDKTKHKSTGTSKAVRDSLAGGTDGEAAPPAAAPAALPSPTGTSAPTTTEEAPKAT